MGYYLNDPRTIFTENRNANTDNITMDGHGSLVVDHIRRGSVNTEPIYVPKHGILNIMHWAKRAIYLQNPIEIFECVEYMSYFTWSSISQFWVTWYESTQSHKYCVRQFVEVLIKTILNNQAKNGRCSWKLGAGLI